MICINQILNGRIAIHCTTREHCYAVLQMLDKQNLKWANGERAINRVPYALYQTATCIAIWDGHIWSENIDWYKKHSYKIIECTEIEDLPEVNMFSII